MSKIDQQQAAATSEETNESGVSRRGFIGGSIAAMGAAVAYSGQASAYGAKSANPSSKSFPAMDVDQLDVVEQEMVTPPFLPKHDQVAPEKPRLVKVRLVVEEKQITLSPNGEKIWAFTFNGSVPGPMIVCHEGDYVECTLVNPATNKLHHNIDFHSSTGALGGATLTEVGPGEEAILRFKATKAGVFIYHCAPGGVMIPFHVVSGMNGAMMVLPRDGLKDKQGNAIRYDRAYYVGEQDFYLPKDENGKYKEYSAPMAAMGDMLEVMKTLTPTHVVFNGAVGALTGKNALKANVGETVLVLHSQANRDTRPHLIGGHGDYVWASGSFTDDPQTGLETWFIPGGAAGAAIYTFKQPGIYAYVNHNLIEAVMMGGAAHFSVEGEWDDDLMTQVKAPTKI